MSNIVNNLSISNNDTVNVTINNMKRSASNLSASSESSISDVEVKKRKKVNYLAGNGLEEWVPSNEWVLEGKNITKSLKSFRKKNLKNAKESMFLSDVRVLSLSFVFPINLIVTTRCITSYLNEEEANAIRHYITNMEIPLKSATDEAVIHCKKLLDAKEPLSIQFNASEKIDKLVVNLCRFFLTMNTDFFVKSETAFIVKYLVPFLSQVFQYDSNKDLTFSMIDGISKDKTKPDFKLALYSRKRAIDFFFVEVKRPNISSKFQLEDDFVKLLKEMKSSINTQLVLGIASPFSFGLLVEGFRCSLYKMLLVTDGIYLPIMVKMFSLVEYKSDLMNIPAIIESLYYVKEAIEVLKNKLKSRKKEDRGNLKSLVRASYQTKEP